MDKTTLKKTLRSLFPNVREGFFDNMDFDKELKSLATMLEKYDEEAAQRVRDSMGKQTAKDIAELFEAFMQYKEAVDKWSKEDFNFYGGDEVGKILSDLSDQYNKIDQKRIKTLKLLKKAEAGDAESIAVLRSTLGEKVWKEYVTHGKRAIEELANKEREVARLTAGEKAKEKASEILKKRLEEENIDLTDFGDKSIAQVRGLLEDLDGIKKEIETEIAQLFAGGVTAEEVTRMTELREELELLAKKTEDVGEELDKKIKESWINKVQNLTKAFSSLGKEISDFGDILGSDSLVEWGRSLTETSQLAGDLAKKISDLNKEMEGVSEDTAFKDLSAGAKAGIVGIIATAATSLYKSAKQPILDYIEYQDALTEATLRYRDALLEIRRENLTNIFGTDEMKLAAENAKILQEAEDEYAKTLEKINKVRLQGYKMGNGHTFGKTSLADILEDFSNQQGWNLYLDDGALNIDAIEAYYDSFSKKLSRKQKKLIEELIENSKALDDAAAQQAEYLTNLFSGVADSIADSMVDAFVESGDAAIDMGNIMSDVAKNMVSNLIKSMFIKDILDNYEQTLNDIVKDEGKSLDEKTGAALAVLDTALSEIDNLTPQIQAILEKYAEYLKGSEETTEETGLGTGIKEITEDTANLLASYLNAIRADVSYSRAIWERMGSSLQQIAVALAGFSAPSLMEYQAQIASNTYNTMLSTQSILSRLESVIDFEASSIRVV